MVCSNLNYFKQSFLPFEAKEKKKKGQIWKWKWKSLSRVQPFATPGEGNGNSLQYSHLENPMKGGAWWAPIHGVTKSQDMTEWLTHILSIHSIVWKHFPLDKFI